MAKGFAWGATRLVMINLKGVRKFSITSSPNPDYPELPMAVTAWWNDNESVEVGRFSSLNKAQEFIEGLVKEVGNGV